MSAAFGRKAVVELGTSLGISTMYMAAACPETVVYTIEGSSALSEIASENFRIAGLDNIRLLKGSFDSMLPSIRNMKFCPGLVFIDGDHRKEPLLRYFKLIAGISDDKTVIIIDDIYNSGEMAEAWGEIKADKRVTLTIDIFRMGIVFFRRGMSRMDFVIRY
jgi:predicted O-methyltransferase YrrM